MNSFESGNVVPFPGREGVADALIAELERVLETEGVLNESQVAKAELMLKQLEAAMERLQENGTDAQRAHVQADIDMLNEILEHRGVATQEGEEIELTVPYTDEGDTHKEAA